VLAFQCMLRIIGEDWRGGGGRRVGGWKGRGRDIEGGGRGESSKNREQKTVLILL
jgi:hypothetical protein